MSSNQVYIASAARTPIGSFMGKFSKVSAAELGSVVIKEVLNRAAVDSNDVSEVIMGQALTAGQGQNPARQAAISAGIPHDVPAYGVNMLCGSGLKTVYLGYQSILSGDSSIVVSGGQENMTMSPHVMNVRAGIKMDNGVFIDSMICDGLTDAMNSIHMGKTAENLAEKYGITREEQDLIAERSQRLAKIAQENGYFEKEIVPVLANQGRTSIVVNIDEYPKHNTTLDGLAKLRPCFIKTGTVTAGNASGINDSAAAVLLMNEQEIKKRQIKPLAKIIAFAQSGVDPLVMGYAPVPAVEKVLTKAGWSKDDVDLFELNEAFASQAVAVVKGLGLDQEKINIHGGAIALGHPIGASGARVLVTLIYALQRINKKKGVAALCIGGGMGIAIAIELL